MLSMYDVRPTYRKEVKISGWDEVYQSYPKDCPHWQAKPGAAAAYRTWGPTTEPYVPNTTLQDMHADALKAAPLTLRGVRRPIVTFTSYPVVDTKERFKFLKETNIPLPPAFKDLTNPNLSVMKSSYRPICPGTKKPLMMSSPNPIQNQIPKAEIHVDPRFYEHKFLDDLIICPSPYQIIQRQFKRHRDRSFIPWMGKYVE